MILVVTGHEPIVFTRRVIFKLLTLFIFDYFTLSLRTFFNEHLANVVFVRLGVFLKSNCLNPTSLVCFSVILGLLLIFIGSHIID